MTIYDEKEHKNLAGVDDNGNVYYYSREGVHVTDGKDETVLEDVSQLRIMEDVLLCSSNDLTEGTSAAFYTRAKGLKGELKPVSEELAEKLEKATDVFYVYPIRYSEGYGVGQSAATLTNSLLIEYDDDLYLADLKSGSLEFFMDNMHLKNPENIRLTEDRKTAYVQTGSTLYKLTRGKDQWEKERLSRRFGRVRGYRGSGLFFEEEDGTIVAYDGKKAVTFEEIGGSLYDVSDDFKSLAYLEDNKVMFIQEEGKKAERLARDNGGSRIAVFQGYVYYINEDGSLARVRPGKDPEIVMEDVKSFLRVAY